MGSPSPAFVPFTILDPIVCCCFALRHFFLRTEQALLPYHYLICIYSTFPHGHSYHSPTHIHILPFPMDSTSFSVYGFHSPQLPAYLPTFCQTVPFPWMIPLVRFCAFRSHPLPTLLRCRPPPYHVVCSLCILFTFPR